MTTSSAEQARVETFDGSSISCRAARSFVRDTLEEWGHIDLADDAALCVAELAANAVLHARGHFDVVVAPIDGGAHIEVVDGRPAHVPAALPGSGTAADVAATSTTGRGLRVVAAVASRWGVTVATTTKAVWFDVDAESGGEPTEPIVVDQGAAWSAAAGRHVQLVDLPVRDAVASGVQVDDLVREIQLGLFDAAVTDAERSSFYDLLDRSAPARLSGRKAALTAARAGASRFDFDVALTTENMDAVIAFRELLESIPTRHPGTSAAPEPAVVAFRTWIEEEVAAQLGGAAPTPCPLP
jgi:anti-sigma regulatory factor (Ser/Thr protein kinase)